MTADSDRERTPDFERALAELDELASRARSPEVGLDEAIDCLERGVELLKIVTERVEDPATSEGDE